MKFILLNILDINKSINKNEYKILDEKNICEIELSKETLIKNANIYSKKTKNIIEKMCIMFYEAKLKKYILDKENDECYYLLPKNINTTDKHVTYLLNILDKFNLSKLVQVTEMQSNLEKYIEEYVVKNELKSIDLKLLFVYKNIKNIDMNVILNTLSKHKKVNIYLKDTPNKELLNKIDKINDKEGCIIEVIKYNKKAFLDYDVIYYVDDYKTNYPRMRLNKKALVIDMETSLTDKFNSNIIYLNKIENNITKIDSLKDRYGILQIATVLRDI